MKKAILRTAMLVIITAGILFNVFTSESSDMGIVVDSDNSSSPLLTCDNDSIADIEREIDVLVAEKRAEEEELRLEQERLESYENLEKQLNNGTVTLRQLFADTYFAGDSLMHGLNVYGVLDSANMSTMVSASLYHLENSVSKIVSNNPKELVVHYGINMLVNSESARNSFIEQYTRIITDLKEKLPDTEIFISGIFNVSEKMQSRYPSIGDYNEALAAMCKKLGVKYIDNSPVLPGDGSYYGGDGIHLSKKFYSDVWLPHLFYAMNL